MKKILLFLMLSTSVFASEYQFENISKIDAYTDYQVDNIIYDDSKTIMLIMNSSQCYSRTRRCYPYEYKINALAKKINARGIDIYNLDVSYNKYHQNFGIKKLPAVVFISKGTYLKMLEPNTCAYYDRNPDCRLRNLTWVNSLLESTLDSLYQIQ